MVPSLNLHPYTDEVELRHSKMDKQKDEDDDREQRRYALPEKHWIALHEGWARFPDKGGIRMPQVIDELGQRLVPLRRVGVRGLSEDVVDPPRNFPVVLEDRRVLQPLLGRDAPCLRHLRAERQSAGEHL